MEHVSMNTKVGVAKGLAWIACVGLLAAWTGCGDSSSQKLAAVKGKVVFDGQGVKGGTVTFRPLAGRKSASGEVQQDGAFVLSTFGKGDGATVGKCDVMYLPSLPSPKDYEDKPVLPPWAGATPKTKQVDVQAGQNDFTIELVKMGQAAPSPAAPPANQ
jgi:hypothetical protein